MKRIGREGEGKREEWNGKEVEKWEVAEGNQVGGPASYLIEAD